MSDLTVVRAVFNAFPAALAVWILIGCVFF